MRRWRRAGAFGLAAVVHVLALGVLGAMRLGLLTFAGTGPATVRYRAEDHNPRAAMPTRWTFDADAAGALPAGASVRGDFRRLHRVWMATGRAHAGIAILPRPGPVVRRVTRAALLLAWLVAEDGGPASRLAVCGSLQVRLLAGLRLEGFADQDVRLALGLSDA